YSHGHCRVYAWLSLSSTPLRPPPGSPLFPYTTLFRSPVAGLDRRNELDGNEMRSLMEQLEHSMLRVGAGAACCVPVAPSGNASRSEEHTSELQSQSNLVCRLLLEKKKKTMHTQQTQSY